MLAVLAETLADSNTQYFDYFPEYIHRGKLLKPPRRGNIFCGAQLRNILKKCDLVADSCVLTLS